MTSRRAMATLANGDVIPLASGTLNVQDYIG